jgi:hypothetical protein
VNRYCPEEAVCGAMMGEKALAEGLNIAQWLG